MYSLVTLCDWPVTHRNRRLGRLASKRNPALFFHTHSVTDDLSVLAWLDSNWHCSSLYWVFLSLSLFRFVCSLKFVGKLVLEHTLWAVYGLCCVGHCLCFIFRWVGGFVCLLLIWLVSWKTTSLCPSHTIIQSLSHTHHKQHCLTLCGEKSEVVKIKILKIQLGHKNDANLCQVWQFLHTYFINNNGIQNTVLMFWLHIENKHFWK